MREVQRKFNDKVSKLAQMKLDEMDRIESKNARIREIINELKVCGRERAVVLALPKPLRASKRDHGFRN